LKDFATAVKFM